MLSKRLYIPCFSSSQCTLLSRLFFFFSLPPFRLIFFFAAPPLSTVLISSFLNASLGGFSPWKRWTASDWYSVPLLAWEGGGGADTMRKRNARCRRICLFGCGSKWYDWNKWCFWIIPENRFHTNVVAPRREALCKKKHCRTNTTPRKQREWLQPVPHFTPLAGEMKGALLFHLSFAPTHFLSPHTHAQREKKKSSSFDEMPHVQTLVMAAFGSAFFFFCRNT